MSDILDALLFRDGISIGILHWFAIIMVILIILFIGLGIWNVYNAVYVKINTAEVVEENIFVTVVKKDYQASYTTFSRTGKILTPIYHSVSYDVYLRYGEKEFSIDDEKLYNRVNENEKIPAKLTKYLSKAGEVLDTDIEIKNDF